MLYACLNNFGETTTAKVFSAGTAYTLGLLSSLAVIRLTENYVFRVTLLPEEQIKNPSEGQSQKEGQLPRWFTPQSGDRVIVHAPGFLPRTRRFEIPIHEFKPVFDRQTHTFVDARNPKNRTFFVHPARLQTLPLEPLHRFVMKRFYSLELKELSTMKPMVQNLWRPQG